jgi:hypothetical protein
MTPSTKALKSRYRNLCTEVIEQKDGQRVISRTRIRREGAPSLKEWALAAKDGPEWLARKRQRGRAHTIATK